MPPGCGVEVAVDPDGVGMVVTGVGMVVTGVGVLLEEMNVSSQACCSGENNAGGGELGGLLILDPLGLILTSLD